MNNKYHIDVNQEEAILFQDKLLKIDKSEHKLHKILSNWIFWSVLGIHLGIFSVLAVASPKKETTNTEQSKVQEQKITTPPIVPTPQPTVQTTPPSGVPMDNKPEPLKKEETTNKIKTNTPIKNTKTDQKIKEYVVKPGDTVFSITKKYKLNSERLLKLNNIDDRKKITVGQKLRFL